MIRRAQKRMGWITLGAFLASAALGVVVDRAYMAVHVREEREQVRAALWPYSNNLVAAVGRRVAQISGLRAFVESRPDVATLEREFVSFSAGLLGSGGSLRAVQLVRGDHIALVHPMRGNEPALGLNLRTDPRDQVRVDYLRAAATDSVVLSGPLLLRQGDSGLIIRQRVRSRLAGVNYQAALVLDMRALLAEMRLDSAPRGLGVRLYDRNGRPVASTPDSLPSDPVSMAVAIRDGNWELRGGPSAGWVTTTAPWLLTLRLAIVTFVLLVTLLAALLDDRDARLNRDVEQRTASLMELVEERTETIRRQRLTEAELAANEERLRLALAAARMGTFEVDVRIGGLSWSPEAAAMHGLRPDVSIGSISEFVAILDERDRDRVLRAHALALREPSSGAMEYRARGRDGVTRWISTTWLSAAGADGAVRRLIGTVTDITEKKSLEEQLLHSQKMEAVGSLAGGIAHDFNNLLTVILGAGQTARLAADAMPGAEDVRADIDEVIAAGERAAVLTGQLLAFSRRQVVQPRLLDVGHVVGGMSGMLKRLVGEAVSVETTLPDAPMWVFADQGQITQVVMNLAVNARDAMSDGGTLHISVHEAEVTGAHAPPTEGLAPRQYCVVSVADTGEGIDPAVQHLVFDPFFTTKPVGQGTGLGLSTVYGIAVQLGGTVSLRSERGGGTTFDVFLPLADHAVEVPLAHDVDEALLTGSAGQTVLVAEDEPALQRLVESTLAKAGYRVLVAGDGEAALALARAHKGDIALLLSDVVMPAMGGLPLASALVAERPRMRVLFMSGYPQDGGPEGAVTLADSPFLAKPFTPRDLREAVRRALAEE